MNKKMQSLFFLPVLLAIPVLLAVLACGTEPKSAPGKSPDNIVSSEASKPSPGAAPAKWALLVGINHYKCSDKVSPLEGSLNDVEEMRQVLIGKFEFPAENIVVLKDSQATHAAVIDAIQTHLIAKAQPGDIVVFDWSAHGSTTKDVTGKMISGQDQTIVPYDSRCGQVFDISGAELHPLLLQLANKTKNLTFILDSCHSGGMLRDVRPAARVRSIAPDPRPQPPLPAYSVAATREVGATNEEVSPKFVAITAATSRESAFEHFAEGDSHGALTFYLTRQLRTAKAGATYRDIMDSVAGNVTANYPNQHVSLEGAEADQYVFGDGSSLARTYVIASPSLVTPHGVTLSIGQVQGATAGSTYEIYAPASRRLGPPEKAVAKVQLTKVDALTSEGKFVSGSAIAPASRAVEREHQYGRLRMRVFLDGLENSTTLQSVKTELEKLTNIELADRPSACNMQLREAGGKIQTLGADSTTLSPPVAISDSNAVSHVVDQVKDWAKWFNALSIRNPNSDIDLQFTITASQTRDPMARMGKPDVGVWEGETIDAALTNNGARDIYVAILDLSSDGSVSVAYPSEQGAMEVLKPGQKLSRTFRTTIPKGRSVVYDTLKVFAGYKPIDLTPLKQGAIRGDMSVPEASDPLQALLNQSGGTRGIEPVLTKAAELGTWATVQRLLVVKRR